MVVKAHVPDEKRTKLKSKSMPCVFLGFYEGSKAYRLMCVETKRIIKSRNVMFIEESKNIGGVLHTKKVKNVVVHEIVNREVEGEEPLTFSQDTPLNEATMEGVQSESTPSSPSEKKFVVSNDNPSFTTCHEGKTSKEMKGMASRLVNCYQGGGACHYCIFGGAPKY